MSDLGTASGRIVIDTSGVRRAQQDVQSASRLMNQALGAVGISVTVAGFVQLTKAAADYLIQADALATSYRRQQVAATQLAGSQAQLNDLLRVYSAATGGALDDATALANVTQLLSVGFADSTEELDRFARAIRGISIATGRNQDFVTQNLILELFSQRGARLDQLALQYEKVQARADELRQADSRLTKEQAYQNAVLDQALERFGALATSQEGAATGAELASKAIANMRLELGKLAGPGVNIAGLLLADRIQQEINKLNVWIALLQEAIRLQQNFSTGGGTSGTAQPNAPAITPRDENANIRQRQEELRQQRSALIQAREELQSITTVDVSVQLRKTNEQIDDLTNRLANLDAQLRNTALPELLPSAANRSGNVAPSTRPGAGFTADQTAAITEWSRETARIERQAARDRLQATQQYEQQRSQIIRDYGKTLVREAQDFAIARARAEQDYRRSVERTQADALRAEQRQTEDLSRSIAEATTDSDERIADARKQSAKRLSELEADYQRDRLRRAEAFTDNLTDAAGRLDAKAVAEAQRNYRRQERDAKENFDNQRAKLKEQLEERLKDESDALAKSIAQQNAAYTRQLEDAREATRQRLEDAQAEFELRKQREDEDRAIRQQRAAEDNADQLAELERGYNERLAEITRSENEAKTELEQAFNERLESLGIHNEKWLAEQRRWEAQALQDFAAFTAQWRQVMAGTPQGPTPQNPFITPGSFPRINPTGNVSTSSISGVTIAPTIVIDNAAGRTDDQIMSLVRRGLVEALEEVMGA